MFAKLAGAVPPLATWIVQVQLPADSGTLPPTLFVFAAVRSGHVTVIGVDTVGAGVVSTVALAVPARQVPSLVKVAVAVPVAWIVACAPEMVPCVAPNAIGRPSSTAMSAGTTVVASDLCRKSAVRALVPFGRTELGLAPSDSTSHGLNASVAPPPPAPLRTAVSQGAALGPSLHPHQLFVAVTVPGPPLSTRRPLPPPAPPALPTIREKLTVRLPPARIPPPPFWVGALGETLLPMIVTLLSVVDEFALLPL